MSGHGHYRQLRQDNSAPDWTKDKAVVSALQTLLLKLSDDPAILGKYGSNHDGVDGLYGTATKNAFQALVPDAKGRGELIDRAAEYAKIDPAQKAAPAPPPLTLPQIKALAANAPTVASKGTIVVDAGHGGKMRNGKHDPGAKGHYKGKEVHEVDANWALAQDLRKALEARGYKVVMSKKDKYIDNRDRDKDGSARGMALDRTKNAAGALAFISLHQDVRNKDGIQVNYTQQARDVDKIFAQAIADSVRGSAVQNSRNLAVLNPNLHGANCACPTCTGLPKDIGAQQPAVLIEATNFSSKKDIENVMDPAKRANMAEMLASGIDASLNAPHVQAAMKGKPVMTADSGNNGAPLRQQFSILAPPV